MRCNQRPAPRGTFPHIKPQTRTFEATAPDFVYDAMRTVHNLQTRGAVGGSDYIPFAQWCGEVFHAYMQNWLNEYLYGIPFGDFRRLREKGKTLEQIERIAKLAAVARVEVEL